jgi:hypothetical protein
MERRQLYSHPLYRHLSFAFRVNLRESFQVALKSPPQRTTSEAKWSVV